MKCTLILLFSTLLCLPTVAGQQAPAKASENCGEAQAVTARSTDSAGPDDPSRRHEQGVYLLSNGPDGSARLTIIQPHRTELKVNYGKAFLLGLVSYGVIITHLQAVLEGSHAGLATHEETPVFYAYDLVGGLKLAKFNVKNDRREINVGSSDAFFSHLGVDAKSVVEWKVEELSPHIVKLTTLKALPAGEYVILIGKSSNPVYDFAVRPS